MLLGPVSSVYSTQSTKSREHLETTFLVRDYGHASPQQSEGLQWLLDVPTEAQKM
jgi:hypothetical protein